MKKEEYKRLFETEDAHGWFSGMRSIIISVIERFRSADGVRLLDAGCGTGGLLSFLQRYDSMGIDISSEALSFCKRRHITKILQGSVGDLPFKDNSFDIVICFNVLYHKQAGDEFRAAAEIYRICKKGALFLLINPAYNFLWSSHDDKQYAKRRYILGEQKNIMAMAGFKIEKATYLNMFLFPVLFLKRKICDLAETKNEPVSEISPLPRAINYILEFIFHLELCLIGRMDLPFGSTVFCIGRK